jgi:lipopolysaccharide export system permease protein
MGLVRMLTLIDRQLIRSYFKGYFICLVSLLSLYIVVDLFTNLDDFSNHNGGIGTTAHLIGIYYGYKVWQIFDRLCEAILVLAATFTVTWMRRNNEQIPLLSCGVSTQRIVRPVLFSAICMLSLNVINQEMIIPSIGMKMMFQRDDPKGEKEVQVRGAYEPNGVHIEGERANRKGLIIYQFRVTLPTEVIGGLKHLTAEAARYVPPDPRRSQRSGGWEMTGTTSGTTEDIEIPENPAIEQIDKGKFFLHTRKVTFDVLTRHDNAYLLSSTAALYHELQNEESNRQGASQLDRKKAVLFHMRLARPLVSIILVVLGISIILGDNNRNVYIGVGMCLLVCGCFFSATSACKFLGDNNLIAPALSAWIPIFIFGPLALVKFDAVQT